MRQDTRPVLAVLSTMRATLLADDMTMGRYWTFDASESDAMSAATIPGRNDREASVLSQPSEKYRCQTWESRQWTVT